MYKTNIIGIIWRYRVVGTERHPAMAGEGVLSAALRGVCAERGRLSSHGLGRGVSGWC